jgi:hypothetical protein
MPATSDTPLVIPDDRDKDGNRASDNQNAKADQRPVR